jgi:hypothetical protein
MPDPRELRNFSDDGFGGSIPPLDGGLVDGKC